MSDETRLKPELKNLEASLARLTPEPATINRDELMYQSGWAAAMASLGHEQDGVGLRETPRRNPAWIWPVSSALVAAATLLLAVMLMNQLKQAPVSAGRQIEPGDITMKAGDTRANSEIVSRVVPPSELNSRTDEIDVVDKVFNLPSGRILRSGLTLQRELSADGSESPIVRNSNRVNNSKPPATQWQLMDELLPNRRRQSPLRQGLLKTNS